jgi:hypothetical protein
MHADINLQVWLDLHTANGMTTIAPYVSAAKEVDLQYDVRLLSNGPGGTSSIAQSGTVHVVPGRPRQVSVMSVTSQAGGKCEVNLVLRDGREVVGRYSMDCGGK